MISAERLYLDSEFSCVSLAEEGRNMLELSLVENTQPKEIKEDISFLRKMLADLLTQQSSARLTDMQKSQCRSGIRACRSAIDALEMQVLA